MAKDDDNKFKIGGVTVEVMEMGDGLGDAIGKMLKEKFSGRDAAENLRMQAESCLNSHLGSVDDDEAERMTNAIFDICKGGTSGNALMALAQTVVNVIGERCTSDEVRKSVAACERLDDRQRQQAIEAGLHIAECWNCYNRDVSVRLGAFTLLLSKVAAGVTGSQPDAPAEVKAHMKRITDIVEGRDPEAKHN